MKKVVSKTRIKNAKRNLKKYDTILAEVSKKYGVQRFLVSFWGVETNFGRYLGSFNVPPPSRHFLTTVGAALIFVRNYLTHYKSEEGHIKPSDKKGHGLAQWDRASLCHRAFCLMLLIGMGMENAISGN